MSFTSLMMLTTRQVVADEVSTSMVFQLQLPRIFLQLAYLVSRREGRAFASYAQIEGRGLLLLQQQQKAPFDSISNSTFTVLVLPFIFLPCILTIKQTQRATFISRCFSDRKQDIKLKMEKKTPLNLKCVFSVLLAWSHAIVTLYRSSRRCCPTLLSSFCSYHTLDGQ